MNWDAADLRDELAKFKQYCDLIFSGPYSRKREKEQASFILLWIGGQGLETYNSWTWDVAEDRNNPSIIWERFEQHVAPKINHRLARYQLQQFKQKIDESVDDFLTRCRIKLQNADSEIRLNRMSDSSSSSSLERNTKKSKKDYWRRANNLPSTKLSTLPEHTKPPRRNWNSSRAKRRT